MDRQRFFQGCIVVGFFVMLGCGAWCIGWFAHDVVDAVAGPDATPISTPTTTVTTTPSPTHTPTVTPTPLPTCTPFPPTSTPAW